MNRKDLVLLAKEVYPERFEEMQETADRRLKLLRLYDTHRRQKKERCFFCAGEWTCADDCALAEELK